MEPLAKVEVNPPGLMLTLAAPVVAQLNVLLAPALMLAGLAVNDVIAGLDVAAATFTVTVPVTDPALFDAVSV